MVHDSTCEDDSEEQFAEQISAATETLEYVSGRYGKLEGILYGDGADVVGWNHSFVKFVADANCSRGLCSLQLGDAVSLPEARENEATLFRILQGTKAAGTGHEQLCYYCMVHDHTVGRWRYATLGNVRLQLGTSEPSTPAATLFALEQELQDGTVQPLSVCSVVSAAAVSPSRKRVKKQRI